MKKFSFDTEFLQRVSEGSRKLAKNVGCTLGPKGRSVLIHPKGQKPSITKDGVTVAKFISFEDEFENAAAQVIKQASIETVQNAGDGTTTATVIADAIIQNTYKSLTAGHAPVDLRRGIEKALEAALSELSKHVRQVESEEDIRHIANISSNGDTLVANIITDAVSSIGRGGAISITDSKTTRTSLEIIEGFRVDEGYASKAFVNKKNRNLVMFEDALVLVTNLVIDNFSEFKNLIAKVDKERKPLVIIADEVKEKPLEFCIMNALQGNKIAILNPPSFGDHRSELLEDLAISIGAKFIDVEKNHRLADVKLADLGFVKKLEAGPLKSVFVGGAGEIDKISERTDSLRAQMSQMTLVEDISKLQERITRMSSGVAEISVGGATEIEMTERKHRIEDALEAVNSAREEGIIPGGGRLLMEVSHNLLDPSESCVNSGEREGWKIFMRSLRSPFYQMALNAGKNAEVLFVGIKHDVDLGIDFSTEDSEIVNLYENGIVDPYKVTKNALRNSVSAASTLMTTAAAIVEIE